MVEASMEASRAVGFEHDEATTGGPRTKMARVAAQAEAMEHIQRLQAFAGRANFLRNCELSLKSVASEIRRREFFAK